MRVLPRLLAISILLGSGFFGVDRGVGKTQREQSSSPVLSNHLISQASEKKGEPIDSTPVTTFSDWLYLNPAVAKSPNAAVRLGFAWTAFFSGSTYQLHSSLDSTVSEVWPLTGLKGWPAEWTSVDAAYVIDDGAIFLMRGQQYLQLHFDKEHGTFYPVGQPTDLVPDSGETGLFPDHWGGRIDAAVRWNQQLVMFFRGNEYVTFDLVANTVSQQSSMSSWKGWPQNWDKIDAAANPGYGAIYFFRGNEYMTWDFGTNAMMAGPPQSMLPNAPLAKHIADRLVPKSYVSKSVVDIKIGNRTDQPLEVGWINFDGQEKKYLTLKPFETYTQQTASGHLWYAKQGNEVVARYRATPDKLQRFLVFKHPDAIAALTGQDRLVLDANPFAGKSEQVKAYPNSDWLGAGFNLAFVEPTNLGDQKARKRSAIIKTLSSNRSDSQSYFLHHGTRLRTGASTQDRDVQKMVTSTSDLRDSIDIGITQGVEVPELASFSRSLSIGQVNDNKTGSEHVYFLQRSSLQKDTLSLDLIWEESLDNWKRQTLDREFRSRVKMLGKSCTNGYDQIIDEYGTHYSKNVLFGGMYSVLWKVNKNSFDRFSGTRVDFAQHLQAQVPDTPVSVSSGQSIGINRDESQGQKNDSMVAQTFASGGIGFKDADAWKTSVDQSPLPVHIEFAPYTELLNAAFFPDDPKIYDKQEALRTCFEKYYKQIGSTYKEQTTADATAFFTKQVPKELQQKVPDFAYITDLRIVNDPKECPWNVVDRNLNLEAIFSEGYYLCFNRDTKGTPITRIYPISHNAASGSSSCKGQDKRLPQNVNDKWNNFGQSDYICWGTEESEYPLYDIQVRRVAGNVADYTQKPSSASMVLNAGNTLLYLHTQDVKQARDAGKITSERVDVLSNLDIAQ